MISIIIPAYNEADTIGRALTPLVTGAKPDEIDVIVVCNACTDNTAEVARRYGSPVRVIETETPGRANAFNIGEKAAGDVFPRFYIDADVVISLETVRALARRLADGKVLAVAPRGQIDTSASSWAVRWYFDIASLLPSGEDGFGRSGVYGLSREGRSRFGEFPVVMGADDAYTRIHFNAREAETVQTLAATAMPPLTFKTLVAVRTRVRHGHLEVARQVPDLWRQNWQSNLQRPPSLVRRITLWPKLILYGYVTIVARLQARRRLRDRDQLWVRAERTPAKETAL
jgi:hypothetical protein